jgi:hypothetical protein
MSRPSVAWEAPGTISLKPQVTFIRSICLRVVRWH